MSDLLRVKQILQTSSGENCVVEKFLGGGGQGEVYQASWKGNSYALKWYFPHTATPSQLANLKNLALKGGPSSRFLWPLEVLVQDGIAGYGYLMPLRKPNFKGILDLLKRRIEPEYRVLAKACLQMADCFLQLHSKGFCYCDISFGNVFWDPITGDVLLCDNDNVIVNGQKPEILGTMGFMAPEVTTGEAIPGIETDKHSLAVLYFYMFMLHNPMEGSKETAIKCYDQLAKLRIYGKEPVFIFDPQNPSNRPDPRYHQTVINHWAVQPKFIQDIFITAFTKGLSDPTHGRVRESEWKNLFAKYLDSIFPCLCGAENFYCSETLKASPNQQLHCWACQSGLPTPIRIRLGKTVVMLNHDSKLYQHHTNPDMPIDYDTATAQVVQNPNKPSLWGLKNLTTNNWQTINPAGTSTDVLPGKNAVLGDGIQLNFGKITGEIRF